MIVVLTILIWNAPNATKTVSDVQMDILVTLV